MKLDCFYELLVKDVESSASDKATKQSPDCQMEDHKDVIEISHKFRSSTNFYFSYLLRTIVELVMAALLLTWLCMRGIPVLYKVCSCTAFVEFYILILLPLLQKLIYILLLFLG